MSDHATFRDAIIHFAEFENCRQLMVELRWSDGKVKCPKCGAEKVTYLAKRRVWKCYAGHTSPTFSLKTGTIFEDSPIGLEKWLPAVWMLLNCKNGVSSYEIHRAIGVTQKTAWFMDHRIRLSLGLPPSEKLSGECEADESFIGAKARNMHAAKRAKRITGTGGKDKTAVMGILERGKDGKSSKVRTTVIPNRKKSAIQAEVRKHVEAGSALYSDALQSYNGLNEFQHQVIDHAVAYVEGNVHTNGLENFWSLLKRGLNGTYVSVEPFHLFRYLDEQVYRYNNRKLSDGERFAAVMKQIVGRRIVGR